MTQITNTYLLSLLHCFYCIDCCNRSMQLLNLVNLQRLNFFFFLYMNSPPPFSSLAVAVFLVTMCWWVIVLLPAIVLCGRYFYSSQVIRGYLEKALSRDMGNIEEFYTQSSGKYTRVLITSWSCCWERSFGVGCCLWFICLIFVRHMSSSTL